jgi:uncharacterized membrane protein YjgN (DUF898 family)
MDEAGFPAATAAVPATREIPFEFTATGGEYFRIWIVNALLSICTLGIYSAWAKVRRLRYFYGSTSLDGATFDYHGDPKAILKGRLIAGGAYAIFLITSRVSPAFNLLFVPAFAFGIPWIIMRSRRFHLRMTSWRGLRFHFHGRYRDALAAYVGWVLLGMLTLGILLPYSLWKRVNYLLSNTAYGTERFRFTTPVRTFNRFFVITLGLGGGLFFFVAIIMGIVLGVTTAAGKTAAAGSPVPAITGIGMTLIFLTVGPVLGAYFQKSLVNASFGGIEVGPHRLQSRLRTSRLALILVTNLLGIVFTLGLFAPWARVRLMRYQLSQTTVIATGDLGDFTAVAADSSGAVGEEIGEFFDIDFGL